VDLPDRERVRIIKSKGRWLGPKIAQAIEEAKDEVISLFEDDNLLLCLCILIFQNLLSN